jgi:hypothetical protein
MGPPIETSGIDTNTLGTPTGFRGLSERLDEFHP